MNEKRQTLFDRLTAILFCVALFLPMAGMIPHWDLHGGEEDEKRIPAPFPQWSWKVKDLSAYPKRFDAWFSDHFAFRRALIRGHSLVTYFGLRTSPSPKVVLGKHGWFYYDGIHANDGDPIAEYRGLKHMTPFELEHWRWMFQDINDWLHEQGIHFLLILVPAKEMIYPEYMPEYLEPLGPSANTQVSSYLQKHGRFEMTDLTPILREARHEERLYMKTDTHWNLYGAYVGYREIMSRVAAWYPETQPWPLSDYEIRKATDLAGDLAQMMDLRRVLTEEVIDLHPLKPRRGKLQRLGTDDLADVLSTVPDPSLPRAVVFRDSFTEPMLPYLAEHFQRALYIWGRQGVELSPIVTEKPDLVVHILADRILGRSFRYPTRMQVESSARRFDRATNVLSMIDGRTGFPGVRAIESCTVEQRGEDLFVEATNNQCVIELPALGAAESILPIVRFDITSTGKTDLSIKWTNPRAELETQEVRYNVGGPLARGTNGLCLPLMDPEMTGPVRLTFAHKGKYLIHRVEVRGIQRY
jgi:hypothetical protein